VTHVLIFPNLIKQLFFSGFKKKQCILIKGRRRRGRRKEIKAAG